MLAEDVKYAGLAFHHGTPFIDIDPNIDPSDFAEDFAAMVLENYDFCWTMIGLVSSNDSLFSQWNGEWKPIGLVFCFSPHPKARNLILDRMVWFPWASARNRVEAAVKFLVTIRHEIPMVGFSKAEDEAFFNTMLRHGMVRRVGTSYNVIEGEAAKVYETRSEH